MSLLKLEFMAKTERFEILLTKEDKTLIKQNRNILNMGIKIAKELSVGCVIAHTELVIIKGLDYQIHINTEAKYFVLVYKSKAKKCRTFNELKTNELTKYVDFVKKNQNFSDNLIYKFNNLIDE